MFDEIAADSSKILYFTVDGKETKLGEGTEQDEQSIQQLGLMAAETIWLWHAGSARMIAEVEEKKRLNMHDHKLQTKVTNKSYSGTGR